MPRFKITVEAKGPVFDGVADRVMHDVVGAAVAELADIGQTDIKIAANAMDKSGRGGTGRAAAGVQVLDRGEFTKVIWGDMVEGQVWWPWLEGTSKRNRSTGFKGYHAFRTERFRLGHYAPQVLEAKLAERIGEIGGHAG